MDKEKKLAYAFCILKVVLKKLNHELNVLNFCLFKVIYFVICKHYYLFIFNTLIHFYICIIKIIIYYYIYF